MPTAQLVVGPEDDFLEQLTNAAIRHADGSLRVHVAWARDEGMYLLNSAIEPHVDDVNLLVGINQRGTTAEALLRALASGFEVRLFYKHPSQTFHPKLYRFDGGAAGEGSKTLIVGSSNLTRGGLTTNYEANLVLQYDAESEGFPSSQSLADLWDRFWVSPFTHGIPDPETVKWFLERGYLATEAMIRRERRQQKGAGQRNPEDVDRVRTSPPPRSPFPGYERVELPFPVPPEVPVEPDAELVDADPVDLVPRRDRFFVRTLTGNDVRKLHGLQTGTFEPDLGETARDRFPAFWGWPDQYEVVTRDLPRHEWAARGRLFSKIRQGGVDIEVMLWYREERPGHAAEHRLRPGPIGAVRDATPDDFTSDSLIVIERAPEETDYDFYVRLITGDELEFDDYAGYLTETRPAHRFGYGP